MCGQRDEEQAQTHLLQKERNQFLKFCSPYLEQRKHFFIFVKIKLVNYKVVQESCCSLWTIYIIVSFENSARISIDMP